MGTVCVFQFYPTTLFRFIEYERYFSSLGLISRPIITCMITQRVNADALSSTISDEDVQKEFVPNGGRMNVRENAIEVIGATQLPSDCNSHPVNHGIHNQVSSINQLGNIEFSNRSNVNPRNDFGLAKTVLQKNQLAQSVV